MPTIFTRNASAEIRTERQSRTNKGFSLSRVIGAMTSESGRLDGYELEVLQELSRASGDSYLDPHRIPLPLQLLADPTLRPDRLSRALTVGDAGAALVGTETMPVVDLLRGFSVAADTGVTILDVPRNRGINDIVIPKLDGETQWHWLEDEGDELQQSDPNIGKITLSPHGGGAFTKYSRLLARQGSVADALLQRALLGNVGRMIDHAILNSTGATGQPTGIVNIAAANHVGPAVMDYQAAVHMEYLASLAGARDETISYLASPLSRKKLRLMTANTVGTEFLVKSELAGGQSMAGRRFNVSLDAPDDTVVCGPWPDCVLAMWGVPVLEINPNDPEGFKAGTFEARVVTDIDIGLLHPEAWTVHEFTQP